MTRTLYVAAGLTAMLPLGYPAAAQTADDPSSPDTAGPTDAISVR